MRRDTSGVWNVIVTQPGIPDDSIFVEIFFPARSDINLVMILTCGLGANARQGAHNRSRCKQINILKYRT